MYFINQTKTLFVLDVSVSVELNKTILAASDHVVEVIRRVVVRIVGCFYNFVKPFLGESKFASVEGESCLREGN